MPDTPTASPSRTALELTDSAHTVYLLARAPAGVAAGMYASQETWLTLQLAYPEPKPHRCFGLPIFRDDSMPFGAFDVRAAAWATTAAGRAVLLPDDLFTLFTGTSQEVVSAIRAFNLAFGIALDDLADGDIIKAGMDGLATEYAAR